jgi:hypothetical protein
MEGIVAWHRFGEEGWFDSSSGASEFHLWNWSWNEASSKMVIASCFRSHAEETEKAHDMRSST